MRNFLLCLLLGVISQGAAYAQAANPSTEQMIEKLKSPPPSRSLGAARNLVVGAGPATSAINAASKPATGAVPVPEPVAVARRPSVSLSIEFDFNSAQVKPESQKALANLAKALQSSELKANAFSIEGHTDAKGNDAGNVKLSQQRANAVLQLLKVKGVEENRLSAIGKGSTELANAADPYAAENRRVRIVNLN
jgi:outer membrane protein OmpA-like peptidoglycan-associated protein